ncbi:MAG: hypothetical protein JXA25_04700 [Anaerolineales bacterium]|nr:hypothetical protein [Anaerolineales bacterium]
MTVEKYFDFHDVVGYKLNTSDSEAQRFFIDEYRHHLQDISMEEWVEKPLVTLNWRRGIPLLAGDSFRFHMHKILARWSYQIEHGENSIRIKAVGNRFAVSMVHHMMVHPSLRYLASMQDTLMLHGAAVVKNGQSIILTGRGGAGKTTTSSMLLAQGGSEWQLHADDYVYIGAGPQTYAYMTRSHLYKDLLRWLPQLREQLTVSERIRLFIYGTIREWTRDGIKWPVRLSAERLWPDHQLASRARLGKVLLLRRAPVSAPQLVDISSLDEVVDSLAEMNFYEARHFIHLMNNKTGTPLPEDWLEAWRMREKQLLKRYLSQTSVQWLELPESRQLDPRLGHQLVDLLDPSMPNPDQEG